MENKEQDIQEIKLKNLEEQLEELGKALEDFKQKHSKENEELNNRVREMEEKYNGLEIILAEIKKDINHSSTEIKDIKDLSNTQLAEQRQFFNKTFKYLLITVCLVVFILLGVKVADVMQLFI